MRKYSNKIVINYDMCQLCRLLFLIIFFNFVAGKWNNASYNMKERPNICLPCNDELAKWKLRDDIIQITITSINRTNVQPRGIDSDYDLIKNFKIASYQKEDVVKSWIDADNPQWDLITWHLRNPEKQTYPRHCADIGGNHGIYSVHMALLGCEVEYFEIQSEIAPFAQRSLSLNFIDNRVNLHLLGLADRRAIVSVKGAHGYGFIGPESSATGRTVTIVRGDRCLARESMDLVKIDVEGAEIRTLEGLGASLYLFISAETVSNPSLQYIRYQYLQIRTFPFLLSPVPFSLSHLFSVFISYFVLLYIVCEREYKLSLDTLCGYECILSSDIVCRCACKSSFYVLSNFPNFFRVSRLTIFLFNS